MDKRYGGVSKTRQFTAGKLLNYFTLPKTNQLTLVLKMDGWKLEDDPFILGFGLFFSGSQTLLNACFAA